MASLWPRLPAFSAFPVSAAATVLLFCVAAAYLALAHGAREAYNRLISSELPGANKIRYGREAITGLPLVSATIMRALRRVYPVTRSAQSSHLDGQRHTRRLGHGRLEPRQMRSSLLWPKILSEHLTLVQSIIDFWNRNHGELNSLPLVRYLRENFKAVTGRRASSRLWCTMSVVLPPLNPMARHQGR